MLLIGEFAASFVTLRGGLSYFPPDVEPRICLVDSAPHPVEAAARHNSPFLPRVGWLAATAPLSISLDGFLNEPRRCN